MKSIRLLVIFIATLLGTVGTSPLRAVTVEDEIKAIQDRIIAKAQNGLSSEADLARELNQLSDLCIKYRSQKSIAAEILLYRAHVYDQVIKDKEMAMVIYIQILTEYPGTSAANVAASTIEAAQATADDQPAKPRKRPGSGTLSSSRASSSSPSTSSSRGGSTPEVGAMFPDFNVQDLDDAPLSVSQFEGQVVLIDFWATWCGPCVEEMDNVMAIYRKYHDKGFEIIGISLDRDRAPLVNFIRQRTITWPMHFDQGGALGKRYGIKSIPATFLLDRTGKVIAVDLRGYELERALQRALER